MSIPKNAVKRALFGIMKAHERAGKLDERTPRMLRSEISIQFGNSVEDLKDEIKTWISDYFSGNQNVSESSSGDEASRVVKIIKKPEKKEKSRLGKKLVKKERTKIESSSSSSESEYSSDSSESDRENGDASNITSPSHLRSIAKMMGVPPNFWSNLDRNDFDAVASKLREFCEGKGVAKAGDIPTMSEARKYKSQRESAAELEGINQSNIVESRRRKCRDFIPLF
jgi:hypothetical protein